MFPAFSKTPKSTKYEVRSTILARQRASFRRHKSLHHQPEKHLPKALENGEMMVVAEGSGARRGKFSCSVREIFLHGADGGGARGCFQHSANPPPEPWEYRSFVYIKIVLVCK